MMRSRILAIASTFVLSACVSFSGLDPSSNYENIGDSSVIVLGISPRYRVHVFEGERVGEKWNRDTISTKLNVYPEDGYIVAKVPARSGSSNYGIGGILPDGIGGPLFLPCLGRTTITFDAPKGKVVYVGDISLIQVKTGVRYEASSRLAAAREHLKARFPKLADRLTEGTFEEAELANTPCSPSPGPAITISLPVRR